jgi:hypothetical protein
MRLAATCIRVRFMKTLQFRTGSLALPLLGFAIALLALGLACGGSNSSPTSAAVQPQCDPSLWNNVYDPTRLKVMAPCMTITGTVINQHASDDGDIDMEFALDPQFANLLNSANLAKLSGNLNIEAICQAPIQPDTPQAVPACGSLSRRLTLPPVGAHAQVTGSYVLDTNHGWMEIHPITAIDIR